MRKYIIAFLIVAAGLVLIFNGLSKRSNKNVYAENAFAEHAGDFDTLFNSFKGSVEKDLIREALERSRWNQSRAARFLRITRNTLIYRMQKHGIREPDLV